MAATARFGTALLGLLHARPATGPSAFACLTREATGPSQVAASLPTEPPAAVCDVLASLPGDLDRAVQCALGVTGTATGGAIDGAALQCPLRAPVSRPPAPPDLARVRAAMAALLGPRPVAPSTCRDQGCGVRAPAAPPRSGGEPGLHLPFAATAAPVAPFVAVRRPLDPAAAERPPAAIEDGIFRPPRA